MLGSHPGLRQVAKLMVRVGDHYLFSRKRAPGHIKDNRLELLGGCLEPGESPFVALLREAAEEEATGQLARALAERPPGVQEILVRSKPPEPHFLYWMAMEEGLARSLVADEEESYGLELVAAESIDTDRGLHTIRDRLTPKTQLIFQALGAPPWIAPVPLDRE